MVTDSVRSLALWTALVGIVALAALVLMSVGLGFLGPVNDVLGAATGVLAMLLAFAARDLLPDGIVPRWLALTAAVLGAILIVIGSVLVLTGRTDWYLAGLWSALGWGVLGVWFLILALTILGSTSWPVWLRWLGVIAGVLLVVGLAVLPGILSGIDDWGSAGAGLVAPQVLAYIGSMLLLIWCIGVGRSST
ncbi:hypothetical protein [Longivirga aurantiaca]|uniref:DUF308 domain-containing protein n=1 Tax=Longivirga aurantiaca TaxID=1837743 RepID=A0ABW1SYT2_9ACTN